MNEKNNNNKANTKENVKKYYYIVMWHDEEETGVAGVFYSRKNAEGYKKLQEETTDLTYSVRVDEI